MKERSTIAGVVAVAAIVVGAVLAVFMPAAPAHAGWGSWSGTSSSGVFATWTGSNGQTFNTATSGEFTTTARVRADGGFRIGGVLVDLTSSGIQFSASGTATIDASSSTATPVTLKAKSGNAANVISLDVQTGSTSVYHVNGTGVEQPVPQTALTLATPTDVAISPVSAGSACRMSSTGVSAWTPQETLAVSGDYLCCTNTGTNVITMTEAAGVYEGPAAASAVGQWDTVCMEYVTDRWVQRSFTDN